MIRNCYTCRLPEYHASYPAISEGPAEPAWFQCPLHGNVGTEEIDGGFQCADWLDQDDHPTLIHAQGIPPFLAYPPTTYGPVADLLALAYRIKHQSDLFDNLAERTSPDHARRRQPGMVEAGVTSCGLALVI